MTKSKSAPRKRKGNNPEYKEQKDKIVKIITDLDLDFVNMPEDSRAYMAYRLRLRGHTLGEISKIMGIGIDSVRRMADGVTERMYAETEDFGKQIYATNILRIEMIISRLMPYFMDVTEDGFFAHEIDRDIIAALTSCIKLEMQMQKDFLGGSKSTDTGQSTQNHLHLHIPTMERKSKLVDIANIEQNVESIQHNYPELIEQHVNFINDPRIEKLNKLAPQVGDIEEAAYDTDADED